MSSPEGCGGYVDAVFLVNLGEHVEELLVELCLSLEFLLCLLVGLALVAFGSLHVELRYLDFTDNCGIVSESSLNTCNARPGTVMALHSHSVDPCTGSALDRLKELADILALDLIVFGIVVIEELNVSGSILVRENKCLRNVADVTLEYGVVSGIFTVHTESDPVGILLFVIVSGFDLFVYDVPCIDHALILGIGTVKMLHNALDIPFHPLEHLLFGYELSA